MVDKGNMSELPERLEEHYKTELLGKFPLDDCRKLQIKEPVLKRELIPDLDSYFSFIAGYCSSATRLSRRPIGELRQAIPRLKRSFFDTYPQYAQVADSISAAETPALFELMRASDSARRDLIRIMETLV